MEFNECDFVDDKDCYKLSFSGNACYLCASNVEYIVIDVDGCALGDIASIYVKNCGDKSPCVLCLCK